MAGMAGSTMTCENVLQLSHSLLGIRTHDLWL